MFLIASSCVFREICFQDTWFIDVSDHKYCVLVLNFMNQSYETSFSGPPLKTGHLPLCHWDVFYHVTIEHRSKQESIFILKNISLRPKFLNYYIIYSLAYRQYVSIFYIIPVALIFVENQGQCVAGAFWGV